MPVVFAIVAYFLYALQSYLLDTKFKQFSVAAFLAQAYLVMFVIVGVMLLATMAGSKPVVWPKGKMLWWVLLSGFVMFFADAFITQAYHDAYLKGSEYLFTIVAAAALFPLFVSAVTYVAAQRTPNGWHVASYAMAGVMLALAAKGHVVEMRRDAARKTAAAAQTAPAPRVTLAPTDEPPAPETRH